jgi:hypothetical protein
MGLRRNENWQGRTKLHERKLTALHWLLLSTRNTTRNNTKLNPKINGETLLSDRVKWSSPNAWVIYSTSTNKIHTNMHVLKLVKHNDFLHVSVNHLAIFMEVKHKRWIHKRLNYCSIITNPHIICVNRFWYPFKRRLRGPLKRSGRFGEEEIL